MTTDIYHDLDVYRDEAGNPVTITEQQCAAVLHALDVWSQIRREEGHWAKHPYAVSPLKFDETNSASRPWRSAEIAKSRLLGRLLYEGRRPMRVAPPVVMAEPAYWLVDPELCDRCGWPRDMKAPVVSWSQDSGKKYCSRDWNANE